MHRPYSDVLADLFYPQEWVSGAKSTPVTSSPSSPGVTSRRNIR